MEPATIPGGNPWVKSAFPGDEIYIDFPALSGYLPTSGNPTTLIVQSSGDNTTVINYYKDENAVVPISDPGATKEAVQLDSNLWKVTVDISGNDNAVTVAPPIDLVLVLDRSESMGYSAKPYGPSFQNMWYNDPSTRPDSRLVASQTALTRMIDTLVAVRGADGLDNFHVALVTFDGVAYTNQGFVSLADADVIKDKIWAVVPDPTIADTNPGAGLARAITEIGNTSQPYAKKYVMLFGDGGIEPPADTAKAQNFRDQARTLRNSGVKLMTIAMYTNVAIYDEVDNGGFFQVSDQAGFNSVINAIQSQLVASLKTASLHDPMGEGFVLTNAEGGAFVIGDVERRVLDSDGNEVNDAGDLNYTPGTSSTTEILDWTLPNNTLRGTISYYVKMVNPQSNANIPLDTNGETYINYTNQNTSSGRIDVVEPSATYGVANLTVSHAGELPAAIADAGYQKETFAENGIVPTIEFVGPQTVEHHAVTSVTYNGNEYASFDEFAAANNVEPVDGNANTYSMAAVGGDHTLTYTYTRQQIPFKDTDLSVSKTENLTYNGQQQVVAGASMAEGVTGHIEYSIDGGETWIDGDTVMGTNADDYEVQFRIVGEGLYAGTLESDPVTNTINPLDVASLGGRAVIVTPAEGLTYNGNPQDILVGSWNVADFPILAELAGQGIKYKPKNKPEVLNDSTYDETNAATYEAIFTFDAESVSRNFTGFISKDVSATIGKKDLSTIGNAAFSATGQSKVFKGQPQEVATTSIDETGYPGLAASVSVSYTTPTNPAATPGNVLMGTNVGQYPVQFKFTGTGNYTGSFTHDEVVGEITPKNINDPDFDKEAAFKAQGFTLTFKNEPQTVTGAYIDTSTYSDLAGIITYTPADSADVKNASTHKETNAGVYTDTYTFVASGNYTGTYQKTVTGEIETKDISKESAAALIITSSDRTYNAQSQLLLTAAANTAQYPGLEGVITHEPAGDNPSEPGSEFYMTQVGSYPVNFTIVASGNYTGSQTVQGVGFIQSAGIPADAIVLSEGKTLVYDGSAREIITAKLNTDKYAALEADENGIQYSVDNGLTWVSGDSFSATDVGTYALQFRVTLVGSYTGVAQASGTGHITPADVSTLPAAAFTASGYSMPYSGSAKVVADATYDESISGLVGNITYKPQDGTEEDGSEYSQINVGNYPVTFYFTAEGGNYTGTLERQVEGSITALYIATLPDGVFSVQGFERTYKGEPQEVTLATIDQTDYPGLVAATTVKYTPGTGDFAGSELQGLSYVETNAGVYPVTYTFSAEGNYTGSKTITSSGTINKKSITDEDFAEAIEAAFQTKGYLPFYTGASQMVANAWIDETVLPDLEGEISFVPYKLVDGQKVYGIDRQSSEYSEIQVGQYLVEFVFTASETGNYTGSYKKDEKGVIQMVTTIPTDAVKAEGYTQDYSGSPEEVAKAWVDYENYPQLSAANVVIWSSPDNTNWTEGATFAATDAKDYNVYFKYVFSGGYNATLYSSVEGKINPRDITGDETFAADFIVNGHEQVYDSNPLIVVDADFDLSKYPGLTGAISYTTPTNGVKQNKSEYLEIEANESYPATFTFVAGGNYTGIVEKTATGKISPKNIDDMTPEEKDAAFIATGYTGITYDGMPHKVADASIDNSNFAGLYGKIYLSTDDPSLANNEKTFSEVETSELSGVNAQTYPATFKYVVEGGNYTGTLYKTVAGQINSQNINGLSNALTVEEFAQTFNGGLLPVAEAKINTGLYPDLTGDIYYSVDGGETWEKSDTYSVIDVGEYPVEFKLVGTGNYSGETDPVDARGEIKPSNLDDSIFVAEGYTNLTFNHSAQTVAHAYVDAGAPAGVTENTTITFAIGETYDENTAWAAYDGELGYQETAANEAYPVWFKFEVTSGNYTGTYYKPATGKIAPLNINDKDFGGPAAIVDSISNLVYNGDPQVVTVGKWNTELFSDLQGDISYIPVNTNALVKDANYAETDAGTYKVNYIFTASGNYTGTLYMPGSGFIARQDLSGIDTSAFIATAKEETYNGNPQVVAQASIDESKAPNLTADISYKTPDSDVSVPTSQLSGLDAGDYPVTFTFTGTGNYSGTYQHPEVVGKINRKNIDDEDFDKAAAFKAQGYESVFNNAARLVTSASISTSVVGLTGTIAYLPNGAAEYVDASSHSETQVGSYTDQYLFTATGNYVGTYTKTVTGIITPKDITGQSDAALIVTPTPGTYDTTSQLILSAAPNTDKYPGLTGIITHTPQGDNAGLPGSEYYQTPAGTYPVSFTIVASGNYSGTQTVAANGFIQSADLPSDAVIVSNGTSQVYNSKAQEIVTATLNTGTYPALEADENGFEYSADNGNSWTKGSSFSATNVGSYPVQFRVTLTGSYKGIAQGSGIGYITPADISTLPDSAFSAEAYTQTYSGSAKTVADATYDSTIDGLVGTITYTPAGEAEQTGNVYKQVSVGTYPVTFKFTALGGNYSGSREISVEGKIEALDISTLPEGVFSATGFEKTYNSRAQEVALASIDETGYPGLAASTKVSFVPGAGDNADKVIPGSSYAEINAGNYPVVYTFTASGNYSGTATVGATGSILKKNINDEDFASKIEAAFKVSNYTETYTGDPLLIADAEIDTNVLADLTGDITHTPTGTKVDEAGDQYHETQVGKYGVTFTLTAGGNYEGEYAKSTTGYINPITVIDPKTAFPVVGDTKEFNGADQTIVSTSVNNIAYPGLQVSIEWSTNGIDWYEGSSFEAKNVGKYPVDFRYTATGSYTGTWYNNGVGEITPLDISDDADFAKSFVVTPYGETYTGNPLVVADAKFDYSKYEGLVGTISYLPKDAVASVVGYAYEGIQAGEYPVTFTFTAGGNYKGSVTKEVTGVIAPKKIDDMTPKELEATFIATGYDKLVFNNNEQVVADAKIDNALFPNLVGIISLSTQSEGDDADKNYAPNTAELKGINAADYPATFKFEATGGNYVGTYYKSVVGKISPKNIDDLTPEEKEAAFVANGYSNLTYNQLDQKVADAAFNSALFPGLNGTIAYSSQTSGADKDKSYTAGNIVMGKDASDYPATFKFEAAGNYVGTYYKSVQGKINPLQLTEDEMKAAFEVDAYTDLVYDNSEQQVAWAWFDDKEFPTLTGTIENSTTYSGTYTAGDKVFGVSAAEYPAFFKFSAAGNYSGTYIKDTVGKINAGSLPDDMFVVNGYTNLTYSSNPQVVADAAINTDKYPNVDYTIVYSTDGQKTWSEVSADQLVQLLATDAGDYPVAFKFVVSGDYAGTKVIETSGTISPKKVEDMTPSELDAAFKASGYSTTYNEADQLVANAWFGKDVNIGGTIYVSTAADEDVVENKTYSTGDELWQKNVGDYPAWFKFVATSGNYVGTYYKGVEGHITAKSINDGDFDTAALKAVGYTKTFKEKDQVVADAWFDTDMYASLAGTISLSTQTAGEGETLDYIAGSELYGKNVGSYPVWFKFEAGGNYTGIYYKSAEGSITPWKLSGDELEAAFEAEGYAKVFNGENQVVADASINTVAFPSLSGVITYNTTMDPTNIVSSSVYLERDVKAAYPATFTFVAAGNYSGTYSKYVEGSISAKSINDDDFPGKDVLKAQAFTLPYSAGAQTVASASIDVSVLPDKYADFTGVIRYSTDGGYTWSDASSGALIEYKEINVGSYPVKFRLTGTGNYIGSLMIEDVTGLITASDGKLLQDAFIANEYDPTYSGSPVTIADAAFNTGDYPGLEGNIWYSLDPDAQGDPTHPSWQLGDKAELIDTGNYPVYFMYEVTDDGNDNYNYEGFYFNSANGEIKAANIDDLDPTMAFAVNGYTALTYNSSAQVVADAAFANAAITGTIAYSIDGGESWVEASAITPATYSETKAGEYPVTFRFTGTGNYTGSKDISTQGKIAALDINGLLDKLVANGYDLTYNGSSQLVANADILDPAITASIEYSTDGGTTWVKSDEFNAKDVGDYDVTFRFTGTGDYTGTVEKTVEASISAKSIEDPDFNGKLVLDTKSFAPIYNNKSQKVASGAIDYSKVPAEYAGFTGTIDYSLDGGTTWIPAAEYFETNVGTYPVTFRLTGTGGYTGTITEQVSGQILPIGSLPEDAFIVSEYDPVYTGNPQTIVEGAFNTEDYPGLGGKIAISTDGGETWVSEDEFKATDVGEYPVKIKFTPEGNYTGEYIFDATGVIQAVDINDPAFDGAFAVNGYEELIYNTKDQVVADGAVLDTRIKATIEYSTDGGKTWTAPSTLNRVDYKESAVGDYPVSFRFVGTGNYSGTKILDTAGKISNIDLSSVADKLVATGYEPVYNGTSQTVGEAKVLDPAITVTVEYSTDGGKTWQNGTKYLESEVGDYPVSFRFTGSGVYEGSVIKSANGAIKPLDIGGNDFNGNLALKATPYTKMYNGSAQVVASAQIDRANVPANFTGNISMSTDDGNTWSAASLAITVELNGTNAGSYPVTFKLSGTGNYSGSVTKAVTGLITPADNRLPQDAFVVNNYDKPYDGTPQVIADAAFNTDDYPDVKGKIWYSDDPAAQGNPNHPSWKEGSAVEVTGAGNYPAYFMYEVTDDGDPNRNAEGTYFGSTQGTVSQADLGDLDPATAFAVNGYTNLIYNGNEQVVADAAFRDAKITGTIEYSTDGGNTWSESSRLGFVTYDQTNAGTYPVTFRFVGTGNYKGTALVDTTGIISAASVADFVADFETIGFSYTYDGGSHLVAAAWNSSDRVTGTIDYSLDFLAEELDEPGIQARTLNVLNAGTWKPGRTYYAIEVGMYPVSFRFTGTGNYTGTIIKAAVGYINEVAIIPEPEPTPTPDPTPQPQDPVVTPPTIITVPGDGTDTVVIPSDPTVVTVPGTTVTTPGTTVYTVPGETRVVLLRCKYQRRL